MDNQDNQNELVYIDKARLEDLEKKERVLDYILNIKKENINKKMYDWNIMETRGKN